MGGDETDEADAAHKGHRHRGNKGAQRHAHHDQPVYGNTKAFCGVNTPYGSSKKSKKILKKVLTKKEKRCIIYQG